MKKIFRVCIQYSIVQQIDLSTTHLSLVESELAVQEETRDLHLPAQPNEFYFNVSVCQHHPYKSI